MNTDEESIKFYAKSVFKYQEDAQINYKTAVGSYLQFFLTNNERESYAKADPKFIHNTTGYNGIYIFICQATNIYCPKCVLFNDEKKIISLKLEPDSFRGPKLQFGLI